MDSPVGSGPGDITEDGCAVEFYALLPSFGEPDIVHGAVPEGSSVLELGCGTGRILRPLARLGHQVLGVDQSAGMLAHVRDLPIVPRGGARPDRAGRRRRHHPAGHPRCPVEMKPQWLSGELGVPVVEGIGAPIKMAAMLVSLGLTQSRVRWQKEGAQPR